MKTLVRAVEILAQDIKKRAVVSESLDACTRHYLVTALWSSSDEFEDSGGEPLDNNFDVSDVDEESVAKAKADCDSFREKAGDLIDDLPSDTVGYLFWLSRNGHGAGFFDEYDLEEHVRDRLQKLAESYGGLTPYVAIADENGHYIDPLEVGREDIEEGLASGAYTGVVYIE